MSEWLKIEWGDDHDVLQEWISADIIRAIRVKSGRRLEVDNERVTLAFVPVKSARFVNTEDDKPNNYFVARSCGGCE